MTITKYEGARAANGLFDGKGHAEFTSGSKYSGNFEHGQMHGQGEYVWTDGLVYTGDFVANRIMGTGVHQHIQGLHDCLRRLLSWGREVSPYADLLWLLLQVYQWPSGASYQGGVLNGKRSGFGSMHFAGTDVVYTGQWLDSKRHGQGKLIFDKAQKCFYEGTHVSMPVHLIRHPRSGFCMTPHHKLTMRGVAAKDCIVHKPAMSWSLRCVTIAASQRWYQRLCACSATTLNALGMSQHSV